MKYVYLLIALVNSEKIFTWSVRPTESISSYVLLLGVDVSMIAYEAPPGNFIPNVMRVGSVSYRPLTDEEPASIETLSLQVKKLQGYHFLRRKQHSSDVSAFVEDFPFVMNQAMSQKLSVVESVLGGRRICRVRGVDFSIELTFHRSNWILTNLFCGVISTEQSFPEIVLNRLFATQNCEDFGDPVIAIDLLHLCVSLPDLIYKSTQKLNSVIGPQIFSKGDHNYIQCSPGHIRLLTANGIRLLETGERSLARVCNGSGGIPTWINRPRNRANQSTPHAIPARNKLKFSMKVDRDCVLLGDDVALVISRRPRWHFFQDDQGKPLTKLIGPRDDEIWQVQQVNCFGVHHEVEIQTAFRGQCSPLSLDSYHVSEFEGIIDKICTKLSDELSASTTGESLDECSSRSHGFGVRFRLNGASSKFSVRNVTNEMGSNIDNYPNFEVISDTSIYTCSDVDFRAHRQLLLYGGIQTRIRQDPQADTFTVIFPHSACLEVRSLWWYELLCRNYAKRESKAGRVIGKKKYWLQAAMHFNERGVAYPLHQLCSGDDGVPFFINNDPLGGVTNLMHPGIFDYVMKCLCLLVASAFLVFSSVKLLLL